MVMALLFTRATGYRNITAHNPTPVIFGSAFRTMLQKPAKNPTIIAEWAKIDRTSI
jgi:hypothetical protein